MRKRLVALAVPVVAAGALAVPAHGATKTVLVKDNVFSPKRVTVAKGTTVRWVWRGKSPHNVTVTRGPARFRSAVKMKGSFSRKLTKRGKYSIVCTIHPGMTMSITAR